MQQRIVTKIEANPLLQKHNRQNALMRVAAYCRVSTDSEDQLESYKAQVAYYTDAIAKNPRWRFVEIYADEGITGTIAKKRDNFMRMIRDCEKGKIDLILTKSVARFARNTVDSLKYVRKLKALGVGVYFEEQAIDSMKTDSEMIIGFHSVLAQAESENISANVRWGIQQRMKSGTFAFRYNILGYKKGQDGTPEIVPKEAEIVKHIFLMYLDGKSWGQITDYLNASGIKTPQGKDRWSREQIRNMLSNERYTGDMLLQKTFTENCITKKVKKNRGELPKYLITNNHPAIIDRATFKAVQNEMARRGNIQRTSDKAKTEQGKYSGKYVLSNLLVCGECGSPYRRRIWIRKDRRKVVWRCFNRIEHGTEYCKHSIAVEENRLKDAICRGLNNAIEGNEDAMEMIFSSLSYAVTGQDEVLDLFAMEQQIKELTQHITDSVKLMQSTTGGFEKYKDEISKAQKQISALRTQIDMINDKLKSSDKISVEIERMKKVLTQKSITLEYFDDIDIRSMVEYIRVMSNESIIIVLKGGHQIEEVL